ncbi:hypothetical protein [Parageobacillus galactosidasius]|uniref:Uncharacterized protein n=1 Tax=Parageobacillus galactosidasius TaxID=883812 RepID=A0A226QTH2_9BACL|nr:hypothetical protein [Parageobacillus galactosidasius]OXB94709.1 hypothetical protein B9L23_07535 [Parageobacillus galactosidasius]
MNQSKETPVKTFTSFNGMDAVAVLNDTIIGEFEKYEFTEKLGVILDENRNRTNKKYFQGVITICVFDREPTFRKVMKKEGNEFTIFLANELGQKAAIRFDNIRFIKREGGLKLDDCVMREKYYFECDDHYITNEPWIYEPFGEKPYRFIEENPIDIIDDYTRTLFEKHGEIEFLKHTVNQGLIVKIERDDKRNIFKVRIKPKDKERLKPRSVTSGFQTEEGTIQYAKNRINHYIREMSYDKKE